MRGRRLWQGAVRFMQMVKCLVHSACNRLCSCRIQREASRELLVACLLYIYVTGRAVAGINGVWEVSKLNSVNLRKNVP